MAKAKKGTKSSGKAKAKRGKRRSRAESMTGAKANEVEVRSIGDNSDLAIPEPNDWNHHKKTISGWREKVATARGHLQNAIKTAKKAGIDMEALNDVVAIERQDDPKATMRYFKQLGLGLELGETTIRVSAEDTILNDVEEAAYERGKGDGLAGRTDANRYPEGTALSKEYQRGWRHGQGENMGLTPEQCDAAVNDEPAEPQKVAAE